MQFYRMTYTYILTEWQQIKGCCQLIFYGTYNDLKLVRLTLFTDEVFTEQDLLIRRAWEYGEQKILTPWLKLLWILKHCATSFWFLSSPFSNCEPLIHNYREEVHLYVLTVDDEVDRNFEVRIRDWRVITISTHGHQLYNEPGQAMRSAIVMWIMTNDNDSTSKSQGSPLLAPSCDT